MRFSSFFVAGLLLTACTRDWKQGEGDAGDGGSDSTITAGGEHSSAGSGGSAASGENGRDSTGSDGGRSCEPPGRTVECVCPDGRNGTSVCLSNGDYGECECNPIGIDGGGGAVGGEYGKKGEICSCMVQWGRLPDSTLIPTCADNISESCMFCLNEQLVGNGAESCDELSAAGIEACVAYCPDLVPPPLTLQQCKDLVSRTSGIMFSTEVSDCLCENCLADFGDCLLVKECVDIVQCCYDAGYSGWACYTDPATPCSDFFLRLEVFNLLSLADCNESYRCFNIAP